MWRSLPRALAAGWRCSRPRPAPPETLLIRAWEPPAVGPVRWSGSNSEGAGGEAASPSGPPPPPQQRKDMVALFTCGVCNARSARAFSRQAYEGGVVIVQCGECRNRHLLADHLGWFGEDKGTVEDFLHGEGVSRKQLRPDGTLDLTREELLGAGAGSAPPADQGPG